MRSQQDSRRDVVDQTGMAGIIRDLKIGLISKSKVSSKQAEK